MIDVPSLSALLKTQTNLFLRDSLADPCQWDRIRMIKHTFVIFVNASEWIKKVYKVFFLKWIYKNIKIQLWSLFYFWVWVWCQRHLIRQFWLIQNLMHFENFWWPKKRKISLLRTVHQRSEIRRLNSFVWKSMGAVESLDRLGFWIGLTGKESILKQWLLFLTLSMF